MEIVMSFPVLNELLQTYVVTKRQDVHTHPHAYIIFSDVYSCKKLRSVNNATRMVLTAL